MSACLSEHAILVTAAFSSLLSYSWISRKLIWSSLLLTIWPATSRVFFFSFLPPILKSSSHSAPNEFKKACPSISVSTCFFFDYSLFELFTNLWKESKSSRPSMFLCFVCKALIFLFSSLKSNLIAFGLIKVSVLLWPRWPLVPVPHEYTFPSSLSDKVKVSDVLISRIDSKSFTEPSATPSLVLKYTFFGFFLSSVWWGYPKFKFSARPQVYTSYCFAILKFF